MIAAYNRSQIFKGIFLLLGGLVCYWISWQFFWHGLGLVFRGFKLTAAYIPFIAAFALALITWSGYRQWQNGNGFKTYIESSLYHDLGEDSAGGVVVDYYARRVTGPAYVLSQIFLGGPLLLLRARKHFKQQLPNVTGLEQDLHQVLDALRAANKWQAITDYPETQREILMLAQMKKIEFSAHKGIPRIKTLQSNGI
jgi:hypothetical protein